MFMRTKRLFLRPIFPEDWRAVYRGIADERIVRNLARAPWPYGEEDARQFCQRASDSPGPLAITLPDIEGAPLVGLIGIEPTDDASAELGYWIGREWQACGIATEAVLGVLEIAAMLGMARIEAGHYLDNPASGRVLAKAGFVPTGELRATECLARGAKIMAKRFVRDLEHGMEAAA